MDGCVEFYFEAKKAGIKPIIGSEFYIAPTGTSFSSNVRSASRIARDIYSS